VLPALPILPDLPFIPAAAWEPEGEPLPLPPITSAAFLESAPERRLEALVLDRLLSAVLAGDARAQAVPLAELAHDVAVQTAVFLLAKSRSGGEAEPTRQELAVALLQQLQAMASVERIGSVVRLR